MHSVGESSPEAKGHIMLGSKGRNEKQINQKLVKKKIVILTLDQIEFKVSSIKEGKWYGILMKYNIGILAV